MSVSDWSTGKVQPTAENIYMVSVFFGVSADYLLGLEDESGAKTYIRDSFNNFTNNGSIKF